MGILLRPGHNNSTNKPGWNRTSLSNLISDIDINIKDLGLWGKIIENTKVKDAHSIIYSIPNPWSSAYLYGFILTGGNLGEKLSTIQTKLFDLILYLLYEYAILKKLTLKEIKINTNLKSPIKYLIPEFLRFDNDSIYVFYNTKNEIVGGLSKRSLVWVSQMYDLDNEVLETIKNHKNFKLYLNILKDNKKILSEESYNKFWGLNYFRDLLKDIPDGKQLPLLEENKILPIATFGSDVKGGKYYIDKIEAFVFTEKVIDEEKELIPNVTLDNDIKEKIKSQGYGTEIPNVAIKTDWICIDKFIQKDVLQLESLKSNLENLPYHKENVAESLVLKSGLLYPIHPDLIQALKGRIDLLSFNLKYEEGDRYVYNLKFGCGNSQSDYFPEMEIKPIERALEIWPPFKSKFVKNYVFEFDITSGKDNNNNLLNLNLLEFYDKEGKQIETNYNVFKDFRVYRLEDFPTFIVFKDQCGNNAFGTLKLKEIKKQNTKNDEVEIAIDFGTTRTNLAYKIKGENPDIMTFENSLPITFASSQDDLNIIKHRFLPVKWMLLNNQFVNLNRIKKEPNPTIPFLSIYRSWKQEQDLINYYRDDLFTEGSIYFNSPDKGINKSVLNLVNNILFTNLKWGIGGGSSSQFRTYFIQQLLEMVLVEFEARGYENLKIYWTYPRAFSHDEFLQLRNTWEYFQEKFKNI